MSSLAEPKHLAWPRQASTPAGLAPPDPPPHSGVLLPPVGGSGGRECPRTKQGVWWVAVKQIWRRRACGEEKIWSWRQRDQGLQPGRQQNTLLKVDGEAVEAEVKHAAEV